MEGTMNNRRGCLLGVGGLILLIIVFFVLIQLVPFGRTHVNPPVVQEPKWDSPQTRALAVRACFDCHSNETAYPWYSNVAPVSWLVQRDINEGRQRLNFSDINGTQRTRGGEDREGGGEGFGGGRRENEIGRVIQNGSMPPWYYIIQHPSASLSDQEKQQLIQGLQATLGNQ
jgi:hypothetical protein